MSKVTIRDIRSGKTKTMDERYADVLVKMRRAEYIDEKPAPASRQTYQTKVMTAAPITSTPVVKTPDQPTPEFKENASAAEILANFGIKAPEETVQEEIKRKPGRPAKKTEE